MNNNTIGGKEAADFMRFAASSVVWDAVKRNTDRYAHETGRRIVVNGTRPKHVDRQQLADFRDWYDANVRGRTLPRQRLERRMAALKEVRAKERRRREWLGEWLETTTGGRNFSGDVWY